MLRQLEPVALRSHEASEKLEWREIRSACHLPRQVSGGEEEWDRWHAGGGRRELVYEASGIPDCREFERLI
jgi:hypothetical protein